MAERGGPAVFTIPAHHGFADALAAGLLRRFGRDPMALARGLVLVPNNRAKRAITDAFVRMSGGGLLLPRLVAIGDPDIGEAVGAALDPADADPIPPAIAPLARRLILARLVREERARIGEPVDAGEAVRLAGELARTLDQLLLEEVAPHRLADVEVAPELGEHWQRSLALFRIVLDRWPDELAQASRIDAADRRNRVLDRLVGRWRADAPAGFVCAAGITDSAPAVARLMRYVAELRDGLVVLSGLSLEMPEAEWNSLGPHDPDPVTGRRARAIETDPQFHLKLLLDRMGVARGEISAWRDTGGRDAPLTRGRAIANALAPAAFTGKWTALDADQRRLTGVAAAELPTPADEAQAIALALRETLETPEATAALVTPDRALARRVAAHCARWGIAIDDTAGRPLSLTPPGTLLLALVDAATQGWAPLPLLTLVKHPLARAGEGRGAWLDGVRALDLALRGPRPAAGLAGVTAHLEAAERRGAQALVWWRPVADMFAEVAATFAGGSQPLPALLACLREAAQTLAGDGLWSGPAGRAAADLLTDLETEAPSGPPLVETDSLGAMLRTLCDEIAVRPPQGGHPRLAIYGVIEARLQSADLMILGGLNESIWPGQPAPDPWLAPRIRAELGLPGLERRIGVAAHDLASGLGAPRALLTRARRDARSPAIASRFWLRLQALAGERFTRATALEGWTRQLDAPDGFHPADRPHPCPAADLRPTRISVTEVDRLKADPFAFYARRVLRLTPLDALDADPSAAWRGSAVHDVLRAWAEEDRCAIDALTPRALAMLSDERTHPLLRALWQPRLMEAIGWIERETRALAATGREVIAVERKGVIAIAGVELSGTFDRLDRLPGGGLAVVDYKTGKPPSPAAVRAGFSLQLGLLGLMAERGGFEGIAGTAEVFEYWSLARGRDGFGARSSPVDPDGKRDRIPTADFTAIAAANFADAARDWLTGDRPFTAKLRPEYANFPDYDQLMRRDEWYGRERR